MKLAILDCSTWIDPELEKYGTLGQMVEAWLSPHLPEAEFSQFAIAHGEAFPNIEDYDSFLLPGSESGVYDATDWMEPLRQYLLSIRDSKKYLLGICFGHQMMAHTFGGKAAKEKLGMCAGARCFTVGIETFDANVFHQDQVIEVPPGATVIGSADYCPNAVISYDFPALSMQFHPEYPNQFIEDVIDVFDNSGIMGDNTNEARASINKDMRSDLFGKQAAEFYRGNFPSS